MSQTKRKVGQVTRRKGLSPVPLSGKEAGPALSEMDQGSSLQKITVKSLPTHSQFGIELCVESGHRQVVEGQNRAEVPVMMGMLCGAPSL